MKTSITTAVATLTLILLASQTSFAQYNSNQYYATQQRINQMSAQMTARTNQAMQNLQRQQQQRIAQYQNIAKQTIAKYRKQTGDTTSTDQQIFNKIVNKWRRENPKAWAAQQKSDRQRMQQSNNAHQLRMQQRTAAFNQHQANHRAKVNAFDNAQRRIYQTNNAASDRRQAQTIDMIHDRSNYVNPNNGQVTKLPTYAPNTYHRTNNGTYYQAQNGQYYLYQNGTYTPVNPYNR